MIWQPKPRRPRDYVYIAVDKPYCKIGNTGDVRRRSRELWFPTKGELGARDCVEIVRSWYVPGMGPQVERHVQLYFWYARAFGNDWFWVPLSEMVEAVNDTISMMDGWNRMAAYRVLGARGLYSGRVSKQPK